LRDEQINLPQKPGDHFWYLWFLFYLFYNLDSIFFAK